MCRLAYLSSRAIEKLDADEIAEFFRLLERAQGGHGNGIGGVVDGEFLVVKGVGRSVAELARIVRETPWDSGVIFHTRLATTGGVVDELCHPFVSLDGEILLAHNGHFSDYHSVLRALRALSGVYEGYCAPTVAYALVNGRYVPYVVRGEGCREVSDSWVATEWLSFLARHYGSVERAVIAFHRQYGGTGNYFVMARDGTVYMLIGDRDFEMYAGGGVVVAASSGLEALSIVERGRVVTGSGLVLRVGRDGGVEVVRGALKRRRGAGGGEALERGVGVWR